MNKTWKRKKFLINPQFQLSIISYILVVMLTTIFLFFYSTNYFFQKMMIYGQETGLPADNIYFQFISGQRQIMSMIFLVTTLIYSIIILIFGVLISHRVAGPIHRLNLYLKFHTNAKKEEVPEFHMREQDYFHEVAENLNNFTKGLK